MTKLRYLALYLAALFCSAPSFAQQPYVNLEQRFTSEQMHATGLDTLNPQQLAELNRLLSVSLTTTSSVPNNKQIRSEAKPGVTTLIGLSNGPIVSRLNGSVSEWEPGTEFALDNGQVWKVLKGKLKLRKQLHSPEMKVVPGIAGRWFMQVGDEDVPKPRVYLIN